MILLKKNLKSVRKCYLYNRFSSTKNSQMRASWHTARTIAVFTVHVAIVYLFCFCLFFVCLFFCLFFLFNFYDFFFFSFENDFYRMPGMLLV